MPIRRSAAHVALARGRGLAAELTDLLLPAECAGCGSAGSGWCADCAGATRRGLFPGGPHAVRPDPCPAGLPTVYSLSPYAGPLRAALVAYKDEGRRDLVRVLAPLLAQPLALALRTGDQRAGQRLPAPAGGAVLLVPVPSSPASVRRRGDAPLHGLLAQALGSLPPAASPRGSGKAVVVSALAVTRRVADQAGLDHEQRARNLRGAMAVRGPCSEAVRGRQCVLVDDVLTTGATLAEAARALVRGGASSVRCCTLAATQRRDGSGDVAGAA